MNRGVLKITLAIFPPTPKIGDSVQGCIWSCYALLWSQFEKFTYSCIIYIFHGKPLKTLQENHNYENSSSNFHLSAYIQFIVSR